MSLQGYGIPTMSREGARLILCRSSVETRKFTATANRGRCENAANFSLSSPSRRGKEISQVAFSNKKKTSDT